MHDAWSGDIRQYLDGYRNTALLLLLPLDSLGTGTEAAIASEEAVVRPRPANCMHMHARQRQGRGNTQGRGGDRGMGGGCRRLW